MDSPSLDTLHTKDEMEMDLVRALGGVAVMDDTHWGLASCSRIVFW